jgi:hypothetical protein
MQILIFKFEYLQGGSNILGNGDNGYRFSISSIYKRNQLNRTYRIWTRLNILKFTSLNLNDFIIFQIYLAVVLLDRGHQYDSFAKRINWIWFLEFELYQKYSNSLIWIWMFSNSLNDKYFGFIGFYSFLGIQGHIIFYFWTYGLKDMKVKPFSVLFLIWFFILTGGLAMWLFPIGGYRFG